MRSLKAIFFTICLLASAGAFAQATMTTTGNWNVAGNWTGSNIGDALGEDVTINNSVSPTIPTTLSYTVGNTVLNGDNNLTIDASSTLNVGSSGNARNFTTNLNPNIVVANAATLEIWGDFIANNNVVFNITGTVRIHGNMQFSGAGTNVTVNGTGQLIITGNMTGGGNVNFTVNGAVNVAGNVNIGAGSNLNGVGTFQVGGSCSGTPFCSSGILPVDLLYFRARPTSTSIDLAWATASELDVDFFILEKSNDGQQFREIGKVASLGNSNTERIYTFTDEKPAPGITYFRLNEINRSGKKRALTTIKVNYDGSRQVMIYPNPATKDEPLSLSFNFKTHEAYEVSVFDIRGVHIGSAVIAGSEVQFPIELGQGMYLVKVTSRDFNSVQRIVVR